MYLFYWSHNHPKATCFQLTAKCNQSLLWVSKAENLLHSSYLDIMLGFRLHRPRVLLPQAGIL